MKRSVILAGLFLIQASAFAQSADPINYNLNCRFRGQDKMAGKCHVVINLHEGEVPSGPRQDHLLVNCDGSGVDYNGDAQLSIGENGTVISSVPGPIPQVLLPADALRPSQNPYVTSAWLALEEGTIGGFCKVVTASE